MGQWLNLDQYDRSIDNQLSTSEKLVNIIHKIIATVHDAEKDAAQK